MTQHAAVMTPDDPMEAESRSLTTRDIDRLAKLYIEPTNRCNLDCRTCMRHGWEEPLGFMEFGLFEKIITDASSLPERPSVFFGGFGEPLGHARIADMVALAKQAGSQVELISNGILLDEAMADRLVAVGLDRLWVSIDGASPQSYADVRLGDHLPQIIANLERLNARTVKPELGISFVAMKRNIRDLAAVLELAQHLGASRFSLSNVEPYTKGMATDVLYGRVLFEALPAGGCIMPRFDLLISEGETLSKISTLFPRCACLYSTDPGTGWPMPLPAAPQRQRALGRPPGPLPAAAPHPYGLPERPYAHVARFHLRLAARARIGARSGMRRNTALSGASWTSSPSPPAPPATAATCPTSTTRTASATSTPPAAAACGRRGSSNARKKK